MSAREMPLGANTITRNGGGVGGSFFCPQLLTVFLIFDKISEFIVKFNFVLNM